MCNFIGRIKKWYKKFTNFGQTSFGNSFYIWSSNVNATRQTARGNFFTNDEMDMPKSDERGARKREKERERNWRKEQTELNKYAIIFLCFFFFWLFFCTVANYNVLVLLISMAQQHFSSLVANSPVQFGQWKMHAQFLMKFGKFFVWTKQIRRIRLTLTCHFQDICVILFQIVTLLIAVHSNRFQSTILLHPKLIDKRMFECFDWLRQKKTKNSAAKDW